MRRTMSLLILSLLIMSLLIMSLLTLGGALAPAMAQALPPAAKPEFVVEGTRLILPSPIDFGEMGGRDLPSIESAAALETIKRYLEARPNVSVARVEVHVAPTGSPRADLLLSRRRALMLVRTLQAKGVDCRRLLPVAFGSERPVEGGGDRVEVYDALHGGKDIPGAPLDGGGHVCARPCG